MMNRRTFLRRGMAATWGAAALPLGGRTKRPDAVFDESGVCAGPTYSVIPVVGDGKWVWREPPEGKTGYLEPRRYDLTVGVRLEGTGPAEELLGTTPVPCELPEQRIDDVQIETQGCRAELRRLGPNVDQLLLAAPAVGPGQVIAAAARFRLTLFKFYQGYAKGQFPESQQTQKFSRDFRRLYLSESPGISIRLKEVRKLTDEVGGRYRHPWDKAKAYYEWVWENIEPRIGYFTSVQAALRERAGDCEERAAVFIALCRASGIPARSVIVPGHVWAEFALHGHDGQVHWIPAHTASYTWFGWTGAHEVVFQKGDEVYLPEKRRPFRVSPDWFRYRGSKPEHRFFGELRPLPDSPGADPGPGARIKDEVGEWRVTGEHPLDRVLRDGDRLKSREGATTVVTNP